MGELDAGTERLDGLAHEFAERLRRGEQPDLERWAAEYPDLAGEIHELFPTLVWMERLDSTASGQDSRRKRPDDAPTFPAQLGEYRIVRRIGRGGMGTVYEAVQESLGRRVALKVLSPRDAQNPMLLERFRREAQSAANLHHTNIVPVFGVGEAAGVPFYAMQFIQGQSLDQALAEAVATSPRAIPAAFAAVEADYCRAVARIGLQAADALAYAHAEGVWHRDVKPANMLLDEHGTLWLSDFGLARIEGLTELTAAADVVGTLRYVPPERFEGRTDARGDVYSLGLTLYELLTRRPAFASSSRAELVNQILHRPPVPPRKTDSRIPRDLETIVLKAIAREPERRYASAVAMADDLRRFLTDRPVLARRMSLSEQAWRWCRKNKVLAMVSTSAVLLLVAVASISVTEYIRESHLTDSLRVALQRARTAEARGQHDLLESYIATSQASQLSRREGQRWNSLAALEKAARLLRDMAFPEIERERRRDALRDLAISSLTLADLRDIGNFGASVLAFDKHFLDRIAQRDATGALVVNEWPGGMELARLPNMGDQVNCDFTLDRDTLVVFDQKAHSLHRWRIGEAATSFVAPLGDQDCVLQDWAFNRDGRRLMIVHQFFRQRLIDVHDWPSGDRCYHEILNYEGELPQHAIRLSPDGKSLAMIAGGYGTKDAHLVRVINLSSPRVPVTLPQTAAVSSIAWHPDAQTLAVGLTDSNDIVLWNVPEQRRLRVTKEQRGGGPLLCINSTGELMFSFSSWTNRLAFWHPYTGRPLLTANGDTIFEGKFADGSLLGNSRLAHGDWRYRLAEPSPVMRTLTANPTRPANAWWRDVSVHSGGRLLAVGNNAGVSLFDLDTGLDVGFLPMRLAMHPCFIPATGELLTYSSSGLKRWPVQLSAQDPSHATIGPPEELPLPYTAAVGLEVSSDHSGRVIAVAAQRSAFILHEYGQRLVRLEPLLDCRRIAVSPDGRWVVTANHAPGTLDIWDTETGGLVRRLSEHQSESKVCFSRDSRWLSLDWFEPHLIRTETWEAHDLPEAPGVGFHCFSPDGQLAVHLHPTGATLHEFPSGRRLGTLALPEQPTVWHGTFTPDGTRVILSSNDQLVCYVWDLPQLSRELADLGLDWSSPSVRPAPRSAPRQALVPLSVRVLEKGEDANPRLPDAPHQGEKQ